MSSEKKSGNRRRPSLKQMLKTGYVQNWHFPAGWQEPGSLAHYSIKLYHRDLNPFFAKGDGETEAECMESLAQSIKQCREMKADRDVGPRQKSCSGRDTCDGPGAGRAGPHRGDCHHAEAKVNYEKGD